MSKGKFLENDSNRSGSIANVLVRERSSDNEFAPVPTCVARMFEYISPKGLAFCSLH